MNASGYLSKSIVLLSVSVVICCGIYPLLLWLIGQTLLPFQANGSLLRGPDGAIVGSRLIAQPFTKDEYFHPRPSAAAYDASASASSTLAASNYLLRDRVARALGPFVKYRSGSKAGQLVGPDVEAWFQNDRHQGRPHIVAQWATLHKGLAKAWVTADPSHSAYVQDWARTHPGVAAEWIEMNPGSSQPTAEDLAMLFFEDFSRNNPGRFPSAAVGTGLSPQSHRKVKPIKEGSEIQSIFFDMWRQDHPDEDLYEIPGDMVTTSGSGLDPHITLENAEHQLDRISTKWAANLERDPAALRSEIEQVLQENASAPFGGLAGGKIVNVLEVNIELSKRYGPHHSP